MKIDAYVLSYASHTCYDGRDDIYAECSGVFATIDEARNTMNQGIENSIDDGDKAECYTKISASMTDYVNDEDNEQKEYKVEAVKVPIILNKSEMFQLRRMDLVSDNYRNEVWGKHFTVQEAHDLMQSIHFFSDYFKAERYVHEEFSKMNDKFGGNLTMRKVNEYGHNAWNICWDNDGATISIMSFYLEDVKVSID